MRGLLFFIFRKFKRIENFFCERVKDFLLRGHAGEDGSGNGSGSCKYMTFYRRMATLRHDLYRWVYRKLKPKGVALTEVEGNKIYIDADDLGISRVILIEGAWEKYETDCFKRIVKEGMVVVDIGALFGHYSLIASKLVGSTGLIYAFEPVPKHFDFLCKNIGINGCTNIIPVQKAVSNSSGKVKIWVDKFNIASATLLEENALPVDKLTPDECILPIYVSEKSGIEVETTSLDQFFERDMKTRRINVIKMDVGGSEGLIMDGAKEILRQHSLRIFMEFWPEGLMNMGTDPLQLLQKLRQYGFRIKLIDERKQTLEPIEDVCEFCIKAKPKQEFNLLLEN